MIQAHQLNALRSQARQRAAAAAISIDEARDRIAREHGYSTWEVLVRQVQSPLRDNPRHQPQGASK